MKYFCRYIFGYKIDKNFYFLLINNVVTSGDYMHILMICDANSIWIKKYVEEVLLPVGMNITLLSPKNSIFYKFYAEHDVTVKTTERHKPEGEKIATVLKKYSFLSVIKAFFKKIFPKCILDYVRYYKQCKIIAYALRDVKTFHAVHIHYVTPGAEHLYVPILRHFPGSIVLTYWGSDLLRLTTTPCNMSLLEISTSIICVTQGLKKHFCRIYGNTYTKKTHVLDFGVSVYDAIESVEKNICTKYVEQNPYIVASGKLCVMAGYNANSGQQHEKIISAVNALPPILHSKIHLRLQYSYHYDRPAAYYNNIERHLEESDISWDIIDEFLDEQSTALLRKSVDIFIHAQITDALSASMLEYLYAGAVVLNGVWLKYYELEKLNIHCLQFEDFTQLTTLLEKVILDFDMYKQASKINRAALHAMNSWEAVRKQWVTFYQ